MKVWFVWMAIPGIVFWLAAAPQLITLANPVGHWFEVRGLVVADSRNGEAPHVVMDRVIHRPFIAGWNTIVWRITDHGLDRMCTRASPAPDVYRPDAVPPLRNMEWWMGIPPNVPCTSYPPGQYIFEVNWDLQGPLGSTLRTSARSNVFTVHQTINGDA